MNVLRKIWDGCKWVAFRIFRAVTWLIFGLILGTMVTVFALGGAIVGVIGFVLAAFVWITLTPLVAFSDEFNRDAVEFLEKHGA